MVTESETLPTVSPERRRSDAEAFHELLEREDWRLRENGGRPSSYNREVAFEICERVASGETLSSISQDSHMPSVTTVYRWLHIHKTFAQSFAHARYLQSHSLINKAVDAADDCKTRDEAHVARVKSDVYLKVASRLNPEEYGEKREKSAALQINIHSNLDDPRTLADQRGEYRITYDDAEVVESYDQDASLDNLKDAGIEW